jgi:hypothetical protein
MGETTEGMDAGPPVSEGFPLPLALPVAELVTIHRRTMWMATGAAVVAVAALAPVGDALYSIGICLGLAVGVWNLRGLESSLEKVEPENYKAGRNRFALGRMGRLGVITALAVLLLVAVRSVGLGVVLGVGVFYAVMVANMVVSLAKARRQSLAAEGGATR